MKEIKLSQLGKYKGRYSALVDNQDYEYLSQWKWSLSAIRNKTIYARRVCRVNGTKRNVYMHREILNPPINMEIDHIDHNGLNNQRSNLRICTRIENIQNRSEYTPKPDSGIYRSIMRRERKNKSGEIRIYHYIRYVVYPKGESSYVGRFVTKEEARKCMKEWQSQKKYNIKKN